MCIVLSQTKPFYLLFFRCRPYYQNTEYIPDIFRCVLFATYYDSSLNTSRFTQILQFLFSASSYTTIFSLCLWSNCIIWFILQITRLRYCVKVYYYRKPYLFKYCCGQGTIAYFTYTLIWHQLISLQLRAVAIKLFNWRSPASKCIRLLKLGCVIDIVRSKRILLVTSCNLPRTGPAYCDLSSQFRAIKLIHYWSAVPFASWLWDMCGLRKIAGDCVGEETIPFVYWLCFCALNNKIKRILFG